MAEKKQSIPASNIPFIDQYNKHIAVPWYLYLKWLGDRKSGGEIGPQGPQGPVGPQGPKGDKGDTGSQGSKGDKGDVGDTGPQGPKGDTGDAGPQGPKGDKGDVGPEGPVGPQGAQGEKGEDGAVKFPLLSFAWFDHIANDISWLRADTFSWHSGDVYVAAYEHLVDDFEVISYIESFTVIYYRTPSGDVVINGTQYYAWASDFGNVHLTTNATPQSGDSIYNLDGTVSVGGVDRFITYIKGAQTETISDITITYYLADDGHKICLSDQESNISALYEQTGVAWYYILDTTNKQFKLPRTKWGFTGLRDSAGGYVAQEVLLPNITGTFSGSKTASGGRSGAFYHAGNVDGAYPSGTGTTGVIEGFSASRSSSVYSGNGTNTLIQPRATQMYLYFYVGNYVEDITTIDAGKLAEVVNDFDIDVFKPQVDEAKNEAIVDITDAKTDSIDSLTNLATDLGTSLKYGNVGDIFYTSRLDVSLNGAVECNGNLYNTTDFGGVQSIGNLLRDGKVPYISLAEHQTTVDTYGSCRCFGWDGGNEFRVPKLADVFIEAGVAASEGEFITAGLPNITGSFTQRRDNNANAVSVSGAFTYSNHGGSGDFFYGNNNTSNGQKISFNASRSNSIYGNSNTVQPSAVRYRAMVQLAFGATDDAVVTAGGVVADVSALNSHRVIAFQVPNADNGYTWYRKYADGWVEQGGRLTGTKSSGFNTVTLPVEMQDNNYTASATNISSYVEGTGSSHAYVMAKAGVVNSLATTSLGVFSQNSGEKYSWQVSGMAA